nr:MAG TPA_asm: hypothetical protein [Caudoviricetes sp.]
MSPLLALIAVIAGRKVVNSHMFANICANSD